jgi:hypothetical protein
MSIYPLSYAIPDELIVAVVPEKKHVWAEVVPGFPETYRFGPDDEKEYFQMYQESRFAFTWKKGGWDCLRHYEILANGCIPVFRDLEQCPVDTMVSFPKQLVLSAMKELLPWKETQEYREKYDTYVQQLLNHTRLHLSCSAVAAMFYRTIRQKTDNTPRILFLRGTEGVNYSRDFLFIGLNRLMKQQGGTCICYPQLDYLYDDFPTEQLRTKHGMGYGYGKKLQKIHVLEQAPPSEEHIQQSILEHQWDFIVYCKIGPDETRIGSIPHVMMWQQVQQSYKQNELCFVYGEDSCHDLTTHTMYSNHVRDHSRHGMCFVRELVAPRMKIALGIPCHAGHLKYLPRLFENIQQQTRKPDCILLSISSVTEPITIPNISIPTYVFVSSQRQCAGMNRNVIGSKCDADILCFADADDLLHPQRLELTELYFKMYPHDDLLVCNHYTEAHSIFPSEDAWKTFPWSTIKAPNLQSDCLKIAYERPITIYVQDHKKRPLPRYGDLHRGHIAIRGHVMKKIQYTPNFGCGEDGEFCVNMLKAGMTGGYCYDKTILYLK